MASDLELRRKNILARSIYFTLETDLRVEYEKINKFHSKQLRQEERNFKLRSKFILLADLHLEIREL